MFKLEQVNTLTKSLFLNLTSCFTECLRKVDIAFAIHQNVDQNAFDLTKYFIKSSLAHFQVDADKTHAALLSFGYDDQVVFDFNTKQDLENNLKPRIEALPFVPGKGRMIDLLKMACDNIFCAAGGTRNTVPKVNFDSRYFL